MDNGASALIATSTDTVSVDEDLLRDVLDKTITELEERLISNQDFTESWILRHAAFNRFEIKPEMKTSEKTALANLANAMQKFAATKGFDTVAEAMHFQDESEVQKIMKISEGIAMMTNAGETVDAKLVEQFDVFAEKIKPLKELDKHYKHMMSVLNMVHRTGRKAYASMISTGQEKKLTGALKDMGIDNPNSLILDANKADSSDEQYLENQLYSLKRKDPSAFAAALRKNVMTEREFDAWYTSYYGYLSVEKAKKDFDTQKAVTFGNRLKAFEMDVNSWR